jgi:hypothetical protein
MHRAILVSRKVLLRFSHILLAYSNMDSFSVCLYNLVWIPLCISVLTNRLNIPSADITYVLQLHGVARAEERDSCVPTQEME